jgi:orotate phosphoribosyltransferase
MPAASMTPRARQSPQDPLEALRDLLARQSIRRGEFVLASGDKSNYYCDTKATLLSPRGAKLVGEVLCDLLGEYEVEAAGGLAMGATFIATAIAVASEERGRPIYGFTVRAGRKGHGLEKSVEESYHPDGRPLLTPGRRVAIVEDVVTKGGSVLKAIEAVEERGCDIAIVASIVDRGAGGDEALRAKGLEYVPLFQADQHGNLSIHERRRSGTSTGTEPRS